ncbi:MAG: tetratricopeptide repeat protein [Desulfobacteraceae bacterium]|nr:MAG: tetratricopeptide repeat protein [Desulfobacteraceae bacterium]
MESPSQTKDAAEPEAARMSVEQAVQYAVGLQQSRELEAAEEVYRKILEVDPGHADALHFYGVLQHQRGLTQEACRLISLALDSAPEYTDAHNNLGNILRESDRLEEAEACYRKVIALDSRNANAWNNLGSVLRAKGQLDQAQAAYTRAMAIEPKFFAPFLNMGHLMAKRGQLAEAVSYYAQSIVLDPELSASKRHLGIALSCLGRIEEAADLFRQWVQSEPDNPEARHLLAACSGDQVPQRAPDIYVKHVFDSFAATFEERLATLDYRAPQLVAAAVAHACGSPMADLNILDAGCGTGLCGALLRPFARRLVGVDLSPGMLKRALITGCYDSLREAELTAYIRDHAGQFDLMVSADTLCYFGDLDEVVTAAARALPRKGHFIFTLEHDAQPAVDLHSGYRIQPHGRYCHQESYVRMVIEKAGLTFKTLSHDILRQERGKPVAGMVVTVLAG